MEFSSAQSLTTPLIGTLPEEADLESRQAPAQSSQNDEADITEEETACDRFLTILLPILLLTQFASAYWLDEDLAPVGLEWREICCSTLLFGWTGFLFRRTLIDAKIDWLSLHLLPEIVTVAVCALIYVHFLSLGFLALVVSMLVMALFVILVSIHLLIAGVDGEDEVEETGEDDTEILVV